MSSSVFSDAAEDIPVSIFVFFFEIPSSHKVSASRSMTLTVTDS